MKQAAGAAHPIGLFVGKHGPRHRDRGSRLRSAPDGLVKVFNAAAVRGFLRDNVSAGGEREREETLKA